MATNNSNNNNNNNNNNNSTNNNNSNNQERTGQVKDRSQVKNPQNDSYVKRDTETGEFMQVKSDSEPFKGVRKED
ncbi:MULTISPECIES: hypothetical protein [Staphylococcus]|uniref:Uncharacterized protein n=1 Tax=Staphylococcus hsinchuensis TaxID=3051183 RepID=A0ABZ3E9D9_9STAP|nr:MULTISPECIES: hypothetical protein [unclassified Staphylococcus]